jgi:RNA polymerase sigma-70 factor, ECF subfamily
MAEAAPIDLIARAQRGHLDACGDLYEHFHQQIYHYLYYRTGDPQTAEDLTSDVFIKMVEALSRYQLSAIPFQAWLFQIARNLAIDHYRRNQRRPAASMDETIPDPAPDPDSAIESRLTSAQLGWCLEQIEGTQRDVLLLRFINDLSIKQTAAILHKSEDAVKGLQRRALTTLRGLLGGNHAE